MTPSRPPGDLPLDSHHWIRIKEIFQAAVELTEPERSSWLDRECSDPHLRHEVDALLAADSQADEFFSGLSTLPAARTSEAETRSMSHWVGRRVGPYRITRQIAVGGMGAVCYGERVDGQFYQDVAIKLIKRGMDTDEILRRFIRERQILAGLSHPNVARLLEGGATEDGLPYFAMEYVDGEPITAWCERHGSGLEERLRLFAQACRAVQYAHRNLVVHRDLKPNNILVTPGGEVKLLDFGIAKVLAHESEGAQDWTLPQAMTPAYAAPEQLTGGAITTATDVYALGVVLHELLSGARLYSRSLAHVDEARRVVLEETPLSPSTAARRSAAAAGRPPQPWQPRLKGDLDHIVMRALRKEPEERYASAEALLADVERYLAGLPVAASGATLAYRARKFVARHRVAVGAAGLVLISLIGGLIATSLERSRALAEAKKAGEIKDFTVSLFDLANPYSEQPEAIDVRQLLDRGAVRARSELTTQPEIQAEMLETLGKIYGQLAVYGAAESLLTESLDIRRKHFGAKSRQTASGLYELSLIYDDTGRDSLAAATMRQVIELKRRLYRRDGPEVADAIGGLGAYLLNAGQFAEAESLYRVALAMDERIRGPESAETATDLNNLGILLNHEGRFGEAAPLLERALAIRRRRFGPDHVLAAGTGEAFAECLVASGRLEQARQIYEWVLQVRRSRLDPRHPDLARTVDHLATMARDLGDFAAAESLLLEALKLRREGLGPDHPDLAISLNNLAVFYYRIRDLDHAAEYFQQAHDHWSRTVGADHPHALTSLNNLAGTRREQGRYDESARLFRQVLDKRVALFGADGPPVAPTYLQYGLLHRAKGDLAEAEPMVRRSLTIFRAQEGDQGVDVVTATEALARILRDEGRFTESDSLLFQALSACRAIYSKPSPQMADVEVGLGRVLIAENRSSEAEPLLRDAVAFRAHAFRPGDSRTAEARAALGCCLATLGKVEEARALLESNVAILRRQPGRVDPLAQQGEKALARMAAVAKSS